MVRSKTESEDANEPGAFPPEEHHAIPLPHGPLHEKLVRRRRLIRLAGTGLSICLILLSAIVLFSTVRNVSWHDLRAAFEATGWDQVALACMFTSFSYLMLTGYDALAVRQLALRVFPLITGGTVRYWIYSQKGVSAAKVASLTVIAGVTFWLGMSIVVGAALLFDPTNIAEINHLKVWVNQLIGLGVLAAILVYLIWVSRGHRRTRIQGLALELPGFWLTAGQMVLGVLDLCAAAAVLYVLLPSGHAADFVTFAATYVFGCLLGIASNAPGGIGAFEMTMLKSVAVPSQEGLLASLLLFRAIYYLVPFVLALALLGAHESMRRWKTLREAMKITNDEASESGGVDGLD